MTIKTEIDQIAVPILREVLLEAQNEWLDPQSTYREYRNLQIDKRGSFGERFFAAALLHAFPRRLEIEYKDGDQGDWDLKFNGHKFEVKTASLDVNKKFQNEGIKPIDADYFGILFLGVSPNSLYIKFVTKSAIPFATLHNRTERKTGRGYKWDFKCKDFRKVELISEIRDEFVLQFPAIIK